MRAADNANSFANPVLEKVEGNHDQRRSVFHYHGERFPLILKLKILVEILQKQPEI